MGHAHNYQIMGEFNHHTRVHAVLRSTFLHGTDLRTPLWVKGLSRYAGICPHNPEDFEYETYFADLLAADVHNVIAPDGVYPREFFVLCFNRNPLLKFSHAVPNIAFLTRANWTSMMNESFAAEKRGSDKLCDHHLRILQGGVSISQLEAWLTHCTVDFIRGEQEKYLAHGAIAAEVHRELVEWRKRKVSIREKYGDLKRWRKKAESWKLPWRVTEKMTGSQLEREAFLLKKNCEKIRDAMKI